MSKSACDARPDHTSGVKPTGHRASASDAKPTNHSTPEPVLRSIGAPASIAEYRQGLGTGRAMSLLPICCISNRNSRQVRQRFCQKSLNAIICCYMARRTGWNCEHPCCCNRDMNFLVAALWAIRLGAAAAGSGATCLSLESPRRAWCGHPPGCAWPNTLLARGGLTSGGSVRAFRRLGALMLRAGRVVPALLGVHLQSEQGGDTTFIQHLGCGRR